MIEIENWCFDIKDNFKMYLNLDVVNDVCVIFLIELVFWGIMIFYKGKIILL